MNDLAKNLLKHSQTTDSAPPISPLSFAFMTDEEKAAFKFPASELAEGDTKKDEEQMSPNKNDSNSHSSPSTSPSDSSSRPRKTFKVDDLLIVDDDDEPFSSPDGYEPTAHLGWASFGESIRPPPPTTPPPPPPVLSKVVSAPVPLKRKVYVIHQANRAKTKPYDASNHVSAATKRVSGSPVSPTSKLAKKDVADVVSSDSDADVDVVGLDEEESTLLLDVSDSANPPDLPPQSSLGSRFGLKSKRDNRRGYDSEDDDPSSLRYANNFTPPPRLEPQTTENQNRDLPKKIDEDSVELRSSLDAPQSLKSNKPGPVLPLSKSIMEQKKVALGMTRNAVIKKVDSSKSTTKNFTCAPRSVQIPAYTDKAPMTLYSNVNKPGAFHKDARGRCVRCRDRSPVDMSSFKFVDDSTVISVRAHLCDQTRVMIARTAVWNREYSKKLGDRATGTVWQKPDEVTAQMTGFCSATVRRCIEIANLSIVPRCADRIGVSKNELASLKSAFENEKFFGQTMRTPHVLTHYYSAKSQNSANKGTTNAHGPPLLPRIGRPPAQKVDEEEEKRHHPLTNYLPSTSLQSTSQETSTSPTDITVPPLKKGVLRWTSIQNPRILRTAHAPYPLPRMAVIPVLKKKDVATTSETASTSSGPLTYVPPKKETKKDQAAAPTTGPRKRGRPKKVKPADGIPSRSTEMTLRSRKKEIPIDQVVQGLVQSLISRISGEASG
ncbi:hypothetical protein L3Y34_000748 [Caenorhabditis briggsae]|uniref:Uncharacterized protein n=1 Tax=Caenorhabditis briggsae TaxID=6238 RepID=A0AAE9IN78_CAEBR|nr:hypothetical protein L3Y34_000748 [Caenorhabditis briggsae]